MPPPGWYDDPDHPWTWRYFDGAHWTDHRSPMWVPPASDPRSLSVWFDRSVAAVKQSARRVGVSLGVVWLVLGALGWLLAVASFDDARGRELRRLLDLDQRTFGPFGSSTTTELTSAEADRAWELLQDIFWSALPWLIALAVAFVVASAWSVGVVARAAQRPVDDGSSSARQSPERFATLAGAGVRRVPAVIGSGLVVFLLFVAVWLAASMPVVLVVLVGGGGAAIALTAVFVALLVAVVTAWLWARLTLAAVIAATGGHGIGIRRSWALTRGRFWFVTGRLLITALIAGSLSSVVNLVTTSAQFLEFAPYVALVMLLQAVAAAVAIMVTVCGHLATIEQVDDHHDPH